ncbi:hypothetical protein BX666DRAFT_1881387 [Dichotomocladium elegans]|nr:hypothetical protein BX666DRAFT_1881387 [Dichotomocladium elegans]
MQSALHESSRPFAFYDNKMRALHGHAVQLARTMKYLFPEATTRRSTAARLRSGGRDTRIYIGPFIASPQCLVIGVYHCSSLRIPTKMHYQLAGCGASQNIMHIWSLDRYFLVPSGCRLGRPVDPSCFPADCSSG